jgi:hypothetical protein
MIEETHGVGKFLVYMSLALLVFIVVITFTLRTRYQSFDEQKKLLVDLIMTINYNYGYLDKGIFCNKNHKISS